MFRSFLHIISLLLFLALLGISVRGLGEAYAQSDSFLSEPSAVFDENDADTVCEENFYFFPEFCYFDLSEEETEQEASLDEVNKNFDEKSEFAEKVLGEAFTVFRGIAEGQGQKDAVVRQNCHLLSYLGDEGIKKWVEENAEYRILQRVDLSRICAAFISETNGNEALVDYVQEAGMQALTEAAIEKARNSQIPYLSRLEFEGSILGSDKSYSALTVQPLWQSQNKTDFIFNQLSWIHEGSGTDDGDPDNTVNAGLAYRRLLMDKNLLVGANMFFDHQLDQNHNRYSVGVDAHTSTMGMALNRYVGLSDWKTIDALYEAKALSGWDLELSGQHPSLPSWTLFTKGFLWEYEGDESDVFGYDAFLEWSPVKAITFKAGMRDESGNAPEANAALRLNLALSEPIEEQLQRRTELLSMEARVWDKVRRENTIRTQKRKRSVTELTVLATNGNNKVKTQEDTLGLSVGLSFYMPAKVSVADTVGAIARIQTKNGALLTLAQNTIVRLEPEEVTLVRGSLHYVSGATDVVVNVPGASISLLGTDIDIVSDGTDSSVRVRDGAVRLAGASAGSVLISQAAMAKSSAGSVAEVIEGTADYNAHIQEICETIDWVADVQEGGKVAPYMIMAPFISYETLIPGETLLISLKINEVVTVSGGTPALSFDFGATARTAPLVSGSGTDELVFGYVVQPSDNGENVLTIQEMVDNGASISTDGKELSSVFPVTSLTLSGSVVDVTAPSGYAVVFTTDPINNLNNTAAAFQITGAEIGTTYDYTITSDGGAGSVTNSGTIATATQNITGIDVSGLPEGTLTVSLTLTDAAANVGGAVTDTVVLNLAPELNLVSHEYDAVNRSTYTFSGVSIGAAAADRLIIVVALTAGSGGGINTITLDGTPMTIHAQGNANSQWQNAAVASLAVPTGTTGEFVMTTQSSAARLAHLFIYSATGLNSMTPVGSDSGGYTHPIDLTVPVEENGFIIGGAHVEYASGSPAIWTTANALTVEDGEGTDDFVHYYAGHSEGLSADPAYTVSFRNGNNNGWFGAAMVSWR